MTKEQHIGYANAITELQKKAGEEAKNAALAHALKVLDFSKGNIQAFKVLMERTQKQYMKAVLKILLQEQRKAQQIGREYSGV